MIPITGEPLDVLLLWLVMLMDEWMEQRPAVSVPIRLPGAAAQWAEDATAGIAEASEGALLKLLPANRADSDFD